MEKHGKEIQFTFPSTPQFTFNQIVMKHPFYKILVFPFSEPQRKSGVIQQQSQKHTNEMQHNSFLITPKQADLSF